MISSPWKRTSHWLAALLLSISLLPPVAGAEEPAAAAATGGTAAPIIVAGTAHALLLQPGGTVWAWGHGDQGQLGTGEARDGFEPMLVTGLKAGVKHVAAGGVHSLALGSDGRVWGWGSNASQQVGGTEYSYARPVQHESLTNVTAIAAGGHHSLALKAGTVLGWGANERGQLGNGTLWLAEAPVPVPGLSGVTAIAAGSDHSLALTSDGSVWAWGANDTGAVGDGTREDRTAPVKVSGLSHVMKIAAGGGMSFALTADGALWGWGSNFAGGVGTGSFADEVVPVRVMQDVALVAPGLAHTLALKHDGTVWAWGYNSSGQLGYDGNNSSVPVQIPTLTGATALAAGYQHSLAIKPDGTIYGWGANRYGQLGTNGEPGTSAMPIPSMVGLVLSSPVLAADPLEPLRVTTNQVTFSGITYPRATVTAAVDGKRLTAVADARGNFSLKNVGFRTGKTTPVVFTASNAGGASSPSLRFPVLVDNQPPQVQELSLRLVELDGRTSTAALTQKGTTYSGTATAAYEVRLHGSADEPLTKITASPALRNVTIRGREFDMSLRPLKKGANTVTVELTDTVGKKTRLSLKLNYEAGPIMTIATPRTDVAFGTPKDGAPTIPVTFTGSADEKITKLMVVRAGTGDLIKEVDLSSAPTSTWKVTIEHDAAEASSIRYRFLGMNKAGHISAPSPTDADVRAVTIDPLPPELKVDLPTDGFVIFTNGNDGHFGVKKQRIQVEGHAFDGYSGLKQVTVGSVKLKPPTDSPHDITLKVPIALKDQQVNRIAIIAEDNVGNNASNMVAVLMKSRISKLSAGGSWSKSSDTLKITGATDPAINADTKAHPWWIGIVPVEFRRSAPKGDFPGATGLSESVPLSVVGEEAASAQDACYDFTTGKFSCTLSTSDMPDGLYTIYVIAQPPREFPDLERKVFSFQITIRR